MNHIRIKGYKGTWHVIDSQVILGKKYHLLEHEILGDYSVYLIVDENYNFVSETEDNLNEFKNEI